MSIILIKKLDGAMLYEKNICQYDAFGGVQTYQEEIHNRIFYTGQQYDQSSGQYYLRARYYNSVVGRFLQEDVYRGDGLNLYVYCKNNTVIYYDPSGLGRSSINYTKVPQKDWPEKAIVTEKVTGSPNIPTKEEDFKIRFDNLTTIQLDELYQSQNTKDCIKSRLCGKKASMNGIWCAMRMNLKEWDLQQVI